MKSDSRKYALIVVLGLYIAVVGINRFHFLPLENHIHSYSYSLGNNVGLIFRVLLGLALITKGMLFFNKNISK
ncbi:hypothetical protein SAMN05443667_101619 [Flavobacterium gillisiae]|uniref:Uncharacterized protein n=1 Tax=Flavobacterium gillisiae TaxID=150146 RepID=A0A1H3XQD6_9FLAO|nr:hypothetical protein [Flavobacterium gillisiae]SEA01675.1 hypothetical protein SAMN05443667_101619 [Flavobacterium gillisiae]